MKMSNSAQNVLGQELQACCNDPLTGYFRNGKCDTSPQDYGVHTVCAQVNEDFLKFTKEQGNDLSTPMPAYNFPGLKPGDRWCLCVARWQEALAAGFAPPVVLESTHEKTLENVPLSVLQEHAVNL